MAFGDYPVDAPDKPNKGLEGGACNRQRCQAEPALWFNHGTNKWYCGECAHQIGNDPVNYRDWMRDYWPQVQHPMFETRADMDRRENLVSRTRSFAPRSAPPDLFDKPSRFKRRYGRHRKDAHLLPKRY